MPLLKASGVVWARAAGRQASIDNELDLADAFWWGREDAKLWPGSGECLPSPTGCADVEAVFLRKMGLGWKDVVALMGAHTLGRGGEEVSNEHMARAFHLLQSRMCVYFDILNPVIVCVIFSYEISSPGITELGWTRTRTLR